MKIGTFKDTYYKFKDGSSDLRIQKTGSNSSLSSDSSEENSILSRKKLKRSNSEVNLNPKNMDDQQASKSESAKLEDTIHINDKDKTFDMTTLRDALPKTKKSNEIAKPCSIDKGEEDLNMDELCGYFENNLNIPKRMSSMAESMYA